jgi:hypothetical protein
MRTQPADEVAAAVLVTEISQNLPHGKTA